MHLPDHLEASIEGLEGGSHVTAGEIKLPTGVELAAEADLILAVISVAPTAEELEGEAAGEVPAEAGAEGAAGADESAEAPAEATV